MLRTLSLLFLPMGLTLLRLPATPWTTFCYVMIAAASLTGSLITLIGLIGGLVALWQMVMVRERPFPAEGRLLAAAFVIYFAVLAVTTAMNGSEPGRFIELILISPFIYFIPLALHLPNRCTDISLSGIGRAAMIGTVPTALLLLWVSEMMGVDRPELAPGNANVLSGILILQSVLCLAGWRLAGPLERSLAASSALLGILSIAIAKGSRGALVALGLMVLISVLVLIWNLPLKKRLLALSFGGLALAVSLVMLGPFILAKGMPLFQAVSDPGYGDWINSPGQRLTMYKAAVAVILDHPWAGMGMHQRFDGTLAYYAVTPPESNYFTHVHNLMLTHGTAAGVPGMLAVLLVLAVPISIGLRATRHAWDVRWFGLVVPVGLFGLGLTETVLFQDLNITFFMFLFVLVSVVGHRSQLKPPFGT